MVVALGPLSAKLVSPNSSSTSPKSSSGKAGSPNSSSMMVGSNTPNPSEAKGSSTTCSTKSQANSRANPASTGRPRPGPTRYEMPHTSAGRPRNSSIENGGTSSASSVRNRARPGRPRMTAVTPALAAGASRSRCIRAYPASTTSSESTMPVAGDPLPSPSPSWASPEIRNSPITATAHPAAAIATHMRGSARRCARGSSRRPGRRRPPMFIAIGSQYDGAEAPGTRRGPAGAGPRAWFRSATGVAQNAEPPGGGGGVGPPGGGGGAPGPS